ncbi:uncharacterized protein [Haliotis cracherodii]|uniref:uncharacterized protein n=1 Tax=Haliotis cracherodii TaxID=6455 RepID=UPI0039ED774C
MTSAATCDSRHFVTLDADEIIVINSKAQSTNKNTCPAIKIFKLDKKNHRGDLLDSNEPKPRIYGTGNPSLPVASFKQYVSKLHPENTALFQRPRKHTNTPPDTHWYTAQALGHNSLRQMMKSISKEAKLSKTYTNHCVRATTAFLGAGCRQGPLSVKLEFRSPLL